MCVNDIALACAEHLDSSISLSKNTIVAKVFVLSL